MRRIGAWMMALLLCVVGTGCGRQLGSPISYEDFTGTYPVEGYVPSQEDLGHPIPMPEQVRIFPWS